jgi:hypothetical protein
VRTQSLVGHVVAMGITHADIDEGAVELMALAHRDRRLVAETTQRLRYLLPGDDITLACDIVVEALRRGDASSFWVPTRRVDYDYSPLDLFARAV